ncbi:aspartic peptidase domain-containing protein, partial [Delphinella strobiligena]
NTSLLGVEGGSVFLAPITIGGQAFNVVIDTGSSDTWLNAANLTCIDESSKAIIPTSDCKFGPSCTFSPIANLIDTENFNISYADGEFLNGDMLYENMTFAGISISQQQMGLVNYAAWDGDGISSGLVGLAYPELTNAYNGTNATKDVPGTSIPYNPLFTTLYTRNLTLPIFSLALQRAPSTAYTAAGGLLALGGIPSIHAGIIFTSTPIAITGIDSSSGANEYNYYTISISGWALAANRSAIFDVHSTGNPRYTPLLSPLPAHTVIVDSGTSLLYAPSSVVQNLATLFSPPALLNETYNLYTVDCAAEAPTFGVVVGSKVFYVNQVDLVVVVAEGVCVMGVQENGGDGAFTILGDVFLRSVLAVFDVGAGEVRFAAREFWDVT